MNHIYQVTFSPVNRAINEIEEWLILERRETGEGFYCNWSHIKSSFESNEIAVISLHGEAVGFATWRLTSAKSARIEIAEVKPNYRKKGIGRKLISELLDFLKASNISVVDLQCAPSESEPAWKKLGFLEFPDPPENYNFGSGEDKKLYTILRPHMKTSSDLLGDNTIEIWNDEPYTTRPTTPATYMWNLEFKNGSRELIEPIIHPAYHEWRVRWRIDGIVIGDTKVKRFKPEIDFGKFVIISELVN